MVLAVPHHVRELGGKCLSISILKINSWGVKNVFKFNNGVSYEVISSYMYKLLPHPTMDSLISFERYPAAKKCLKGVDVEVSVKGEPGEPYCTIPRDRLKLLNKFL